jgi:translation initiation factor 2 subunit 3
MSKNKELIQPEVNIGLVGHVDHGKTTLTERLSGKWTDTHSEEIKRGITIKLGYADTSFYKDNEGIYTVKEKNALTKENHDFVRKISLVDAPGHESLMATMLAGATLMDGAILLVAANESCPQPQTKEHLMALEISGIKNVIIAQNKIDLVDNKRALKNYTQIKEFLKGTSYENSPIVPISAQHGVNIDMLIEAIQTHIPTPKRNSDEKPRFLVARSFDTNKPGIAPKDMVGGILGGSLLSGKLKKGDRVEIRPGRIVEEHNQLVAKPLFTTIKSIVAGGKSFDDITPGGSMGLLTELDPGIVKSDSLTGSLVGIPGELPEIWYDLRLEVNLLERVVGSQEEIQVQPIKMQELLMLNVNSAATVGIVVDISKNEVLCKLKLPICADISSRVSISRRVGTRFRLIGFGIIKALK